MIDKNKEEVNIRIDVLIPVTEDMINVSIIEEVDK